MIATQIEKEPPNKPPVVTTGYVSDEIEDIANRIIKLTKQEAKNLVKIINPG